MRHECLFRQAACSDHASACPPRSSRRTARRDRMNHGVPKVVGFPGALSCRIVWCEGKSAQNQRLISWHSTEELENEIELAPVSYRSGACQNFTCGAVATALRSDSSRLKNSCA